MSTKEFLGLRTVIYKVDDIKKAKKWYAKVLNKSPHFDKPFYVGFNVAGYELGLQPVQQENKHAVQAETAYWGVGDIEKSYRRLLELGAKANEPPENVGEDIMTATVKDPWGNELGIIYNPSFEAKS